MECIINTGYALGCSDGISGIDEIYVFGFAKDNIYVEDGDNIITSLLNSTSGTITAYKYEQFQELADFNQEYIHDTPSGTLKFDQTLNLVFRRNDAIVRNSLLMLAKTSVHVIIKKRDGSYLLMGRDVGAYLTSGTTGSGKEFGTLNGSNISLIAKNTISANFVSDAAIAALNIA